MHIEIFNFKILEFVELFFCDLFKPLFKLVKHSYHHSDFSNSGFLPLTAPPFEESCYPAFFFPHVYILSFAQVFFIS
jgi:hypothetical protein